MAQMQTQLNNTNKNGGNDNNNNDGNKSNEVPFWRQFYCWTHDAYNFQGSYCCAKAEFHNEIRLSINNSTGAIAIAVILKRRTIPEGVGKTVK